MGPSGHRRATPGGTQQPKSAERILALEPDARQAAAIRRLVGDHLQADLILVESRDAAVTEIERDVPDLFLVTALLSPPDEQALVTLLRTIDAAHLELLTIPLLAHASRPDEGRRRSFLSGLKRRRQARPEGCDPAVFAQEIRTYLERARDVKEQREYERRRLAAEAGHEPPAEFSEPETVVYAPDAAVVSTAESIGAPDPARSPAPQEAAAEAASPTAEPLVEATGDLADSSVEPAPAELESPLPPTEPATTEPATQEQAPAAPRNGFALTPPDPGIDSPLEADAPEDSPASSVLSEDDRPLPFDEPPEPIRPAPGGGPEGHHVVASLENGTDAEVPAQTPSSLASELEAALRARTGLYPDTFSPMERLPNLSDAPALPADAGDGGLDFLADLDTILQDDAEAPVWESGRPTASIEPETPPAQAAEPPDSFLPAAGVPDQMWPRRGPNSSADCSTEADDEFIARLTRELLGREVPDASLDVVASGEHTTAEEASATADASRLPAADCAWLFSAIDELRADLQQMRAASLDQAQRARPPAPPRLVPLAAWAYRTDDRTRLAATLEEVARLLEQRESPLPLADVAYVSGCRIRRVRIRRRKAGRRRRQAQRAPLIIVSREALDAARAADAESRPPESRSASSEAPVLP